MASSSKSNTSLADCKSSSSKGGIQNKSQKSYKAGKVTRNPFFNFLREYRTKNNGKSVIEIARQGGAAWRALDGKAKEPYKKQAAGAPKTVRKMKRGRSGSCSSSRGGKRSKSKRHRSSRSSSSGSCGGKRKSKKSKSKRHRSSSSCSSKGSRKAKSKRHSSGKKHHKQRKHHKKSSGSGCGKRSKSKASHHSGGYSSQQSMYY